MPPSVTTKGGTLSPRDRKALQIAASEADRDRCERGELPAVSDPGLADCKPVLQAALGDGRAHQPGKGEERADRQVDAGGQDDEGHADSEQPR